MRATVFVTLKQGVLDPQGQAVQRSLARLGYQEVEGVRLGKYIEIELGSESADEARSRLTEMCERLLANTVIENYRIEIEG